MPTAVGSCGAHTAQDGLHVAEVSNIEKDNVEVLLGAIR